MYFDLINKKMNPVEILDSITSLFEFGTQKDADGNEYVFYDFLCSSEIMSPPDPPGGANDRTGREALQNHIHIIDKPKKCDFDSLCRSGEKLGKMMLAKLKYDFPDKKFCVFVTIQTDETMIIRFHQQWEGEKPYYDSDNMADAKCFGFYG